MQGTRSRSKRVSFFRQTSSVPFVADANRICSGPDKYIREGWNLCCSRCPPGHKLKEECTYDKDTVCEPCGPEQFMERWNFIGNCFTCIKCKEMKGLQYAQNCSSTTSSKCVCLPGRYCLFEENRNCRECPRYKKCREGFGVSMPGTAASDVKCRRCPEGTFSDSVSHTQACKPHSFCDERHIISKGNATSDTLCKAAASTPAKAVPVTEPETTVMSVTTAAELSTRTPKSFPQHNRNNTTPGGLLSPINELPNRTPPDTGADKQLAAVIGVVAGIFLLLIVIILLILCKRVSKKATLEHCPKVDANGNCETDDVSPTNVCYLGDTEHLSLKAVQPEQQGLLQNGHANQDQGLCNKDASIGHLQTTLPLHQPHSALSEPLPLQSNMDQVVSQTGTSLQPSSQPTSPQSMAPSPLVNVNINLHIGNGTCGPPAVMFTDMAPAEPTIPFGEEEESCSLLQQEDGKPSLLSVEESGKFNNMSSKH
ncbi:tumor necrosis factor receptor superfamily member 1B [Eucyclogobius newberryi]|uniref:tumor necrosis factor receptor superfamily member 1B n=1 Tax=Eucyclogobius newberryi TaxID=166745 RepID=UPI003B5A216A